MESTEIRELLRRCADKDDDAFSELVLRYTPMINKEIGSFSSKSLSTDELFSEACIALHHAAMTFDTEQESVTFGLYAKICIRHKLIDAISVTPKAETTAELDIEQLAVSPSIDTRLADAERFEALMVYSKRMLSDYEYKVLILHIQGYKTSEIARTLGRESKSVDNAKNRIFRRLREFLNENPSV